MIRKLPMVILCLTVVTVTSRTAAQDGWYLRTNLGFAVAPGLTLDARDNDWSTRCDKLSNPGLGETAADECASTPPITGWTHEVGRGNGMQSVLALGYSWSGLRVEGEYIYRTTTYARGQGESQVIDEVTQQKNRQELETIDGGLEDLLAHGVFANVYYDFRSDSPFTPYFGVGLGLTSTSLDYYGRFKRNDDPDAISTFEDPLRKARLAGTTTIGRHKLNDMLTAYQAVLGADYALNEKVGIGLRVRWAKFSEFDAGDQWTQLRSHESSVGQGFDVVYSVSTDKLAMFGASLNMTYSF